MRASDSFRALSVLGFALLGVTGLGACGKDQTRSFSSSAQRTPEDKCEFVYLVYDADGDGAGVSTQDPDSGLINKRQCEDEPRAQGWVLAGEYQDCDDTDPEISISVCQDQDNDLFCTAEAAKCVGSVREGMRHAYTAFFTIDCDDTDPLNNFAQLEDADGDGAFLPGSICGSANILEQDGGLKELDCDDAEPTRAPHLAELSGDGVDSDCDGFDDAICTIEPGCGCGEYLPWPEASGCSGVDLRWTGVEACLCGPVFAVVGNAGTETFVGELVLVEEGGASEEGERDPPGAMGGASNSSEEGGAEGAFVGVFSVTLAPGEATAPIEVARGDRALSLRIVNAESSCASKNNRLVLPEREDRCSVVVR